jgi:glycosyltransferase involved in cell wall biosynthesis
MMSPWAWGHRPWRKRLGRWLVHPGAFAAVRGWHATSTEEESEIRALGFAQPICVAPNGVDAPSAEEYALAHEHWRTACPATAQQPAAVFYSRFHRKKRVLELIDAWLQHAPADWLLLLAGIPQDYTPEDLEQYALRMSGGGRVRAFNSLGRPPPYAVASLFLLPSHSENFGLVVAEAMAHGLPALVTDTTPWKELDRQESGWCVPWEDFGPALARVTTESLEALRARGVRARTWVLDQFSWDRSARLLGDFYAALVQDR